MELWAVGSCSGRLLAAIQMMKSSSGECHAECKEWLRVGASRWNGCKQTEDVFVFVFLHVHCYSERKVKKFRMSPELFMICCIWSFACLLIVATGHRQSGLLRGCLSWRCTHVPASVLPYHLLTKCAGSAANVLFILVKYDSKGGWNSLVSIFFFFLFPWLTVGD